MDTLVASNLPGMPGVDLQNLMGWLARYFIVSIRMASFFLPPVFWRTLYLADHSNRVGNGGGDVCIPKGRCTIR